MSSKREAKKSRINSSYNYSLQFCALVRHYYHITSLLRRLRAATTTTSQSFVVIHDFR
jgi:hypothetical protein